MLQQKIAEIISKLKKVREENGLSYQKIVELVEQNGGNVSLSTVKRVFEDGSESYGFQYENTLKPIADAVLGIYTEDADIMEGIYSIRIIDVTGYGRAVNQFKQRGFGRLLCINLAVNIVNRILQKRTTM